MIALLFLLLVGAAVLTEKLPAVVLVIYLAASLVTFILYAMDKAAARKGRQRTPESTLHWMAVLGGWPGALIAQRILRHKSIKREFRRVFWATIVINCAALAYFLAVQVEAAHQ